MTIREIKNGSDEERKEWAETLRGYADQVEAGEVTNSIFIGNDKDEYCYFAAADVRDRWQLLGAIEYAKDKVANQ